MAENNKRKSAGASIIPTLEHLKNHENYKWRHPDPGPNEYLIDPRELLPFVGEIITRVKAPKVLLSVANPGKSVEGMDLSAHRESIAQLLSEAMEAYETEKGNFELLHDLNKPKKRHADNFTGDGAVEDDIDWGEHAVSYEEIEKQWDAHWLDTYARGPGNPGVSRSGGPSLTPAHSVYCLTRRWWQDKGLGKFHPTFVSFKCEDEEYDETEFNAPSRFLLCILQGVDSRYTVDNARGLYETMRKTRKKRKK